MTNCTIRDKTPQSIPVGSIRIHKIRMIHEDWKTLLRLQCGERFMTNRRLEMDFDTSHERVMTMISPHRCQGSRRWICERRKEVALGKLKSLAVLVALGANGGGLIAAPWTDVPASAGRPQPPVPPIEYVKAGAKLFNSGDTQKAAQYLKAAND